MSEKKCEYIWKTTSKKGTICGRKLSSKNNDSLCFQHKKLVQKEQDEKMEEEKPKTHSVKATKCIQLVNTPAKKVIQKKKKKISSESSSSSSSSASSDSSSSSLDLLDSE